MEPNPSRDALSILVDIVFCDMSPPPSLVVLLFLLRSFFFPFLPHPLLIVCGISNTQFSIVFIEYSKEFTPALVFRFDRDRYGNIK